MLTTLRIKNLALVEDLTLELQPGYNAITGETGAGKSIIIGALNLVLGERANRGLIRSGADQCTVEAVVDLRRVKAPLAALLDEHGLEPCDDHQLLLKRVFSSSGSNKQFINGSPTTLNVLAAVGDWLVDMHGPHDHQSLLHPSRQLALLDAFAGSESDVQTFGDLLASRAQIETAKADLVVDEQTYQQRLDLLRFQVREINEANLNPDEDEELNAEHQRASNASELIETAQHAINLLDDDDDSLVARLGQLGQQINALHRLDEGTGGLVELNGQVNSLLRDLHSELDAYAERVEVDPARLMELNERVELFQSLKRKYGPDIEDVIVFGQNAADELHTLESRDAELERLNAELVTLDTKIQKAGAKISKSRAKVVEKLGKSVVRQLRDLGFKQSHFAAALSRVDTPSATGFDRVEFQFAPNVGEPPQSLREIASSGEMARVMLAIKTVLAAEDRIPVLIFDEVDANVGGETAHVVGEKMRAISKNRQVLCITHLPQVAAVADHHLLVTKSVSAKRTITTIEGVDGEERVSELARMLGGKGDMPKKHAEELLSGVGAG